jgi:hypothetical protein
MEVDGEPLALATDERETLLRNDPENAAYAFELEARLLRDYPEAQYVRDVVVARYGALPPWSGFYHFALGVAALVVTEDGAFPVSVRKGGAVSVNVGLNVPASGGVEVALWSNQWDRPAIELLELAMRNEVRRELGLPDESYDLRIAGFFREATRGGSPEFFFVVYFRGSAMELLQYVTKNKDVERKELSGEMRLFSLAEIVAAFRYSHELGTRFHHKLMAAVGVACGPCWIAGSTDVISLSRGACQG